MWAPISNICGLNARTGEKGFTLVEVLVASIILFSTIAIGTVAIRTAQEQLDRITARTLTATAVVYVTDLVRNDLQEGRVQGESDWGKDVHYRWYARVLQKKRSVLGTSEFEVGLEYGGFWMSLYQVTLSLRVKSPVVHKPRIYEYKELIYQPAAR